MIGIKEEVRRKKSGEVVVKGSRSRVMVVREEEFRGSGGQRRRLEGESGGKTHNTGSPSFPSGFSLAGGFRLGKKPQGVSWCGGVQRRGQSGSGAQARKP